MRIRSKLREVQETRRLEEAKAHGPSELQKLRTLVNSAAARRKLLRDMEEYVSEGEVLNATGAAHTAARREAMAGLTTSS